MTLILSLCVCDSDARAILSDAEKVRGQFCLSLCVCVGERSPDLPFLVGSALVFFVSSIFSGRTRLFQRRRRRHSGCQAATAAVTVVADFARLLSQSLHRIFATTEIVTRCLRSGWMQCKQAQRSGSQSRLSVPASPHTQRGREDRTAHQSRTGERDKDLAAGGWVPDALRGSRLRPYSGTD